MVAEVMANNGWWIAVVMDRADDCDRVDGDGDHRTTYRPERKKRYKYKYRHGLRVRHYSNGNDIHSVAKKARHGMAWHQRRKPYGDGTLGVLPWREESWGDDVMAPCLCGLGSYSHASLRVSEEAGGETPKQA